MQYGLYYIAWCAGALYQVRRTWYVVSSALYYYSFLVRRSWGKIVQSSLYVACGKNCPVWVIKGAKGGNTCQSSKMYLLPVLYHGQ